MFDKIKGIVGNIINNSKLSSNYNTNLEDAALNDAKSYVYTLYDNLRKYIDDRYCRHNYKNSTLPSTSLPYLDIDYIDGDIDGYAEYLKYSCSIRIPSKTLYLQPLIYRGILVHEVFHHVVAYGRVIFGDLDIPVTSMKCKEPIEELVCYGWQFNYLGYSFKDIVDRFVKEFLPVKNNTTKTFTRVLVYNLMADGFIPNNNPDITLMRTINGETRFSRTNNENYGQTSGHKTRINV